MMTTMTTGTKTMMTTLSKQLDNELGALLLGWFFVFAGIFIAVSFLTFNATTVLLLIGGVLLIAIGVTILSMLFLRHQWGYVKEITRAYLKLSRDK